MFYGERGPERLSGTTTPRPACFSQALGLLFSCHYDAVVPSVPWTHQCHCLPLSVLNFTSSYLNCRESQILGLMMNLSRGSRCLPGAETAFLGLPYLKPGPQTHSWLPITQTRNLLSSRSRTQTGEGSLDNIADDGASSAATSVLARPWCLPPGHASLIPELAPWKLRQGRGK